LTLEPVQNLHFNNGGIVRKEFSEDDGNIVSQLLDYSELTTKTLQTTAFAL